MKIKETPSGDVLLNPERQDAFVPIDQVADPAPSPDEALAEKEETLPEYGHIDEQMRKWEVEDRDSDPTPQAWETHPAMNGVPYVAPNPGSEIPDHGAAEEEIFDRKSLLEKLRDWWGNDYAARNPSHSPKKERPKGADTIRGTDWTPADDAPVDKMDEAA